MKTKKIIFYNSNKVWGGGEKWHFNMALALKNLGYDCLLLTYPNSELQKMAIKNGIQTFPIKTSNYSFINPLHYFKLQKIFKQFHPDAIFFNLPSDVKAAAYLAKKLKISKIIYRRGMPHPIKKNLLNSFIYHQLTHIVTNSEEVKKSVIQFFPELLKKCVIIYNGVNPRPYEKKVLSHKLRVGNLGRLVEQKGQQHLVNVAKYLREQNIDFELLIGGKGPKYDELAQKIKNEKLQGQVKLLGHIDPHHFFSQIDLFLFPSHFEGLANALIESLNYSTPAICFKTSSMPEVIQHKVNGLLVPPLDEVAMAKAIIRLKDDPKLYEKIQSMTLKTVHDKFIYEKAIKQVEAIINE